MTAPLRHAEIPVPPAPVHMAATLHWFLIQIVAQGHTLAAASAALKDGIDTQARALADAGLP
jgi:hypothetical protein